MKSCLPPNLCFTDRVLHSFGDYEVDTDRMEVRALGAVVRTEPQVFAVLQYLIEHHERVVTKEELFDEIWGSRYVSESALSSRVKDARRAVGDDGRRQEVIRTVHGRGYRFVHEDLRSAEASAPAAAMSPMSRSDGSGTATTDGLGLMVDREFPFVGRSEALAVADELADGAGDGTRVLLLGGEPGIGKSRLAIEIAAGLADRGWHATGGRCDRHLATSLQPWVEAMTPTIEQSHADELQRDLAAHLDHIRPVMPAIEARLGLGSATSRDRADDYAAIDGLAALVRWLSERSPLVVVLDDVQWAGGATRALTSLLQRNAVPGLMIILTFRTTLGDFDQASSEWVDALTRAGGRRIDLTSLGAEDIDDLVVRSLDEMPEPAVREDVWLRSEGHSLFAVELIRDLRNDVVRDGLPDSVASLVRSRLAKLPSEVATLIGAGSAIGPEFELDPAALAAGLDEHRALDAIEQALAAQLVHEIDGRPDWYRFSHQLVPASALGSMSTSRRLRLHASLAEVLDARGAPSVQVAHHLLEASPITDAADVADRVRRTCAALVLEHQYDRAVELLGRTSDLALDQRTHTEVLVEFGETCNRAGLQPRALEPLTQAARRARSNGWHDLLARAALGLWGQSPFRASQDPTVIALLDEAIADSSTLDDDTQARLLAKRAAFTLFTGPMEERERLSARALEIVGTAPSAARLEVLEARWMAIASPNRVGDCVRLDDELLPLRKELGALTTDACAPEISIYWRGLGEELREVASEVTSDPRQRRDVDQWRSTALSGTFALFQGDVESARRLTDRALPLGHEPWGEAGRVVHGLVHLLIDVMDGDVARSLALWRLIARRVPSDPMRATLAWIEAKAGDPHAARQLLDRVTPRLALLGDNFMGGFGLVGATVAAIELDDDVVLDQLETILRPLGDQMLGHPWAPSLAGAHLQSLIARHRGDAVAADEFWSSAASLYGRLDAPAFCDLRL